jgi:CheY-like chemotaxis protein
MGGNVALVLVADDTPDILYLLQLNLELAGHQVVTADDGLQALSAFAEHDVDAAVLDVTMPGRTGLEVLQDIRRGGRRADVPVVILTAVPRPRLLDGPEPWDAYVTKPFGLKQLVRLVEELISERSTPAVPV